MNYLCIKDLTSKIGSFELKRINFDAQKGDFIAVVGKNGSGKTTFLEAIAGVKKAKGEIWLDGKNIARLPPEKRNVGIVYQDYMLFNNMNVERNILYPTLFNKSPDTRNFFNELVEFLDIGKILKRFPKHLSGGEKQKVAIARAVINNPKILLLDEPLNAIELSLRPLFIEFFGKLHKKYNLTILYITHNFKEALMLSKKTIVILDGQIKQYGATQNIFESPKTVEVARFIGFKNIISTKLLNLQEKNFFSVNPRKFQINPKKKDGLFTFSGNVENVLKTELEYRMKISIKTETVFVYSKKDCINREVEIGFSLKDVIFFD